MNKNAAIELKKEEYNGLSGIECVALMKSKKSIVQKPISMARVIRWSARHDSVYLLQQAVASGNKDQRRLANSALLMFQNANISEFDVTDSELKQLLADTVTLQIFTQPMVDNLLKEGQEETSVWKQVGSPKPGHIDMYLKKGV